MREGRTKGGCELVRKALWIVALASGLTLVTSIAGLASVTVTKVTTEPSPLAGCSNDGQSGRNYVSGEEEPQLAVFGSGPTSKMVGMYHQDRWSNGGAHGVGFAVAQGGAWQPQSVFPSSFCTTSPQDPLHIYERSSDPWVSFGPDGTAYASVISFNNTNNFNSVVAGTMDRNSTTWRDVKTIDGSVFTTAQFSTDKNSTTADPRPTHAGTAYTVWDTLILATDQPDDNPHTQAFSGPAFFSKTVNGGKTWSTAKVIIDTKERQQTIGNIIVVDPKTGTLYDFTDLIISPNTPFRGTHSNAQVAFVKSTDGGNTWSEPQLIAPFNSLGVHAPNTGQLLRVGDGLEEVAIGANGELFVVWESSTNFVKNDQQTVGFSDDEILLATSSDGGATWNGPMVVHTAGGKPTYTPTVAVNGNTLAITYYDNRKLGAETTVLPTDYWVSLFNATTLAFLGEQRITIKSFDQLSAPFARGFFLGDYEGLQPSGNGFEALFVKTNCNAPYNDLSVCGPAFFTGGPSTRTNKNSTDVFAASIS